MLLSVGSISGEAAKVARGEGGCSVPRSCHPPVAAGPRMSSLVVLTCVQWFQFVGSTGRLGIFFGKVLRFFAECCS